MNGIVLRDRLGQTGRIKLTLLPGRKVISEQMAFNAKEVAHFGGKEAVMEALKMAMIRQFRLGPNDVAVLQVVDSRDRNLVQLSCLAHLDGNKDPKTEAEAMKFYPNIFTAPHAESESIPDYIDV